MRTTVTLDEDVLRAVKAEAHRSQRPFKVVLNDLLRRAVAAPASGRHKAFKVEPHHTRLAPGVDRLRFNQLADELEDEAVTAKLRRRS